MSPFQQQRRSLLLAFGGVGISSILSRVAGAEQGGARDGYVLGGAEGEHLVHFRDRGNIFIKAGSATGAADLALGTQQVMTGTGIPVHRHRKSDEAFYVLEGSGNVVLNDVPRSFEKGGTIFIRRNTWHGFENPSQELLLLWVISPAGLDSFFRETCSRVGAPPKGLTRDQIREIALKHDTEFR